MTFLYNYAPVVVQKTEAASTYLSSYYAAPDVRQFVCYDLCQKWYDSLIDFFCCYELSNLFSFFEVSTNYLIHQLQYHIFCLHYGLVVLDVGIVLEEADGS